MNQPETNPEPGGGQEGLSRSAQLIAQRLLKARDKLIDRNLRNRLINTPLDSTRIKAIRVFGESSDQVFATLFSQKRSMAFLPVPDREQQPPLLPQAQEDSEESSSFSYDFSLPSDVGRQEDKYLQTKLGKESLSKKLLSIYYESKEHEEETGVNILFLACGFLKWFEDDNSEVVRFSPLLLLPVILERQKTKGGGFDLRGRDDELMPNISLSVWLDEQFGISLPEIPDDGEWSPTTYFQSVAEVIKKKERWEVLSDDILLGFFSFSKFMMWKDLAPESWHSGMGLSDHPVIQELLKSVTDHSEPASPLIPADDRIDDHFKPRDLTYVLDADSSQTEAIQTALSGKSMVIQGPPGTGKSQSIANLIASAVNKGQTVLFVAEKMAALEVVHRRLEQSGLSELTLEIHSRKANKQAFHEQLKSALDMPAQPSPPMADVDRLGEIQEVLNKHADKLNTPVQPWDFTPFELIGALSRLYRLGIPSLENSIPGADSYTKPQLKGLQTEIGDLIDRLMACNYPELNGYELCDYELLLPSEVDRLEKLLEKIISLSEEIEKGGSDVLVDLIGEPEFQKLTREEAPVTAQIIALLWWVGVLENWERVGEFGYPSIELMGNRSLYDRFEELEELSNACHVIRAHKMFREKTVNAIWESVDIEALLYRFEVHGSGFFSFLSPSYWAIKREVSALFAAEFGSKSFERLTLALKDLVQVKQARSVIKGIDPDLLRDLGAHWKGEDSNLEHLPEFIRHCFSQTSFNVLLSKSPLFEKHFKELCRLSEPSSFRERIDELLARFNEVEVAYGEAKKMLMVSEGPIRLASRIHLPAASLPQTLQDSGLNLKASYYNFGEAHKFPWYRDLTDDEIQGFFEAHRFESKEVSYEVAHFSHYIALYQSALWEAIRWKKNLPLVNYWPPARKKLHELALKLGVGLIEKIYSKEVDLVSLQDLIETDIAEAVWKKYLELDPNLAAIDAHQLNQYLHDFRKLDLQRKQVATREIRVNYISSRPSGEAGVMGLIRQELMKKRKHMPIRKLMENAGAAVQKLKPVFFMSPLSVAQYLAPGRLMFDLVVIDEASQVRPEDALGAIARGKQAIIVGDSQQLPPTNFFSRLVDEEEDEILEGEFSVSDMESILSLADLAFPTKSMLRWHYRSQHPGLIAVSNRNFYDNKLMLPPAVVTGSYSKGLGVSLEKTPENTYQRGGSSGGANAVEADLIAKAVINFARENPEKSLGVAAFSVRQRDAIRDALEMQLTRNPEVLPFFSDGVDEPFFVKNLESIQGDERDVIFISVGYGRTSDGRMYQSFGPLSAAGGERRLNVLISRAKERITVFSSISATDIQAQPGNKGISAFREFLQYAENGYFDLPTETERDFDSDFEESVAIFLRSHGYKVQPQIGMAGFFIDIGVVDPRDEGRFLCGIECDGATYHSSRSARDRDRLRQEILESRGWNIRRIWSTDWFYRRDEQEQQLLVELKSLEQGIFSSADPLVEDDGSDGDSADLFGSSGLNESFDHGEENLTNKDNLPNRWYEEYSQKHQSNKEIPDMTFSELAPIVRAIVCMEGPIHEQEVARRLASTFGYQKAGNKIQARASIVLSKCGLEVNDGFWNEIGSSPRVRDRSKVLSVSLKRADMIAPSEILEAAREIVEASVEISKDDLIVEISRLFGFDRCGPELKKVIGEALSRAENGALEVSQLGNVRLIT